MNVTPSAECQSLTHSDVFRHLWVTGAHEALLPGFALGVTDFGEGVPAPGRTHRARGRRRAHPARRAAHGGPTPRVSQPRRLPPLPRWAARPGSSPGDSDATPTPRKPQPPAATAHTPGEPRREGCAINTVTTRPRSRGRRLPPGSKRPTPAAPPAPAVGFTSHLPVGKARGPAGREVRAKRTEA